MGDDAAVVEVPGAGRLMLLAADAVTAGVDADLSLTSVADLGWKALAVNLSDLAAMGGEPGHALVTVVGARGQELDELYAGILEAAERYACPVVGGDLGDGAQLVVSIAVTGWLPRGAVPVLRRGARAGDTIWVTGPLGASAAGLRLLKEGPAGTDARAADLARAHARPRPALAQGQQARLAGATAMTDVSDGFVADLSHIAEASGVGFELDEVPVAAGATLDEALYGGDDYVLVFTHPSGEGPIASFASAGLGTPYAVGTCVDEQGQRTLAGSPVAVRGWQHGL
jgi:thiamine-monophosphate kinase